MESLYQKKTHVEHILLRPDTYVGSTEPITETMTIVDDQGEVHDQATVYPPAPPPGAAAHEGPPGLATARDWGAPDADWPAPPQDDPAALALLRADADLQWTPGLAQAWAGERVGFD